MSLRSPAYQIKPYSSELVLADGTPAPPAVLHAALNDAGAEVRGEAVGALGAA